MSKRKCSTDDEADLGGGGSACDDDDEDIWNATFIPLPIQTFLWRQTSPFIRPKISRLQDAAAMEQREACKLFEKVLVQNIQFGLSPSLTEAIHSVSRWRLIVAAMPHVMHCCAALLYTRRKSNFDKLSASETKLLYTLHWILLDAAEECADAEMERGIHRLPEHYLLPLTTIQTFVYLFAPLMPHLKRSDFLTSFRLENGFKIWIPLFNLCHPDIPSFCAHAKKNAFFSSRVVKKKVAVPKFGDVFIGANGVDKAKEEQDDGFDFFEPGSPKRATLTAEELKKKHVFNENILAEPALATYLDVAVVRCLFTPQWIEEGVEWALSFILRRLDSINKVDIETRIAADDYGGAVKRARSNSLPTPKRKCSIIEASSLVEPAMSMRSFLDEHLKPAQHRGLKPDASDSNLLAPKGGGQQLKTPSVQDLRRSSFSGLPGLSGFQALISSTTSSSSFGRHGSEKGKHKKQKKQNNTDSSGKENGKKESSMRYASMRRAEVKKSFKFKPTKMSIDEQDTRTQTKPTVLVERPQSVTANYKISDHEDTSFVAHNVDARLKEKLTPKVAMKKRKFSLGDARLLEREDEKGKSMPSLDLISLARLPPSPLAAPGKSSQPLTMPTIVTMEPSPSTSPFLPPPAFPTITITQHSPVAAKSFFGSSSSSPPPPPPVDGQPENYRYSATTTSTASAARIEESGNIASGREYKFYIDEADAPCASACSTSRPSPAPMMYLTRSKTDSDINYSHNWGVSSSVASLNYVTTNGQLRLVVVLRALHSIVLKDSVCSTRICYIIYNILNKLLTLKIITKQSCRFYRAKRYKTLRAAYDNAELTVFHLFTDTLFRLLKQLGCSRGCGEGRREVEAFRLKEAILKSLAQLHEMSQVRFCEYCHMLVLSHSIQEVVDIFHALLGFCSETNPAVSATNPAAPVALMAMAAAHLKVKTTESITAALHRPSYHNNFTSSNAANKTRTMVETVIIKCVFQPFVSRLVHLQRDLMVQENMPLYCEVRQFLAYVRIHHGSVFRDVALAGLIESTKFVLRAEKEQKTKEMLARMALDNQAQSYDCDVADGKSDEQHRLNLKLANLSSFKSCNFDTSECDSLTLERASSPKAMGGDDDSLGSRGFNRTIINTKALSKNIGTFDQQQQHESASLQTYLTINSEPSCLVRRNSLSRQTLKDFTHPAYAYNGFNQKATPFYKAKRRMDNLRNRFVKARSMKQGSSFEETPELSRKNSLDFERTVFVPEDMGGESLTIGEIEQQQQQQQQQYHDTHTDSSRLLPFQILKAGMVKLQFLLESCTPGTIPDAQLVAAMLDLKAPIVARAAFLIECCHFVHRCNKGNWPAWMRINFGFGRSSMGPTVNVARSGSQTVFKSRASASLQKVAGRAFYQWAELLSSRLEDMLYEEIELMDPIDAVDESRSLKTIKGSTLSLTTTDEHETEADNFMAINLVSDKESQCPWALKMIACQLLYEITCFLRETHQYLPTKTSRRPSMVTALAPSPAMLKTVPEEKENIRKKSTMTTIRQKETPSSHHHPPQPPPPRGRRWSMAFPGGGGSGGGNLLTLTGQASSGVHFLDHPPNFVPEQRRISFVLHEVANEDDSSPPTVNSNDDLRQERKRLSQIGFAGLLNTRKSVSGSGGQLENFRRRSIKLKREKPAKQSLLRSTLTIESEEANALELFKRSNSLRMRRKSVFSDRSDNSDRASQPSGDETPRRISYEDVELTLEEQQLPPDPLDANDFEMCQHLAWMKLSECFLVALDFACPHSHGRCTARCARKAVKSSEMLVREVARIYERDVPQFFDPDMLTQKSIDDKEDVAKKEKKLKKILMGHCSPLKRKISVGHNLDRAGGPNPAGTSGQSDSHYGSCSAIGHAGLDVELGLYESEDPRFIFHDVHNYRLESERREENATRMYLLEQVKNPFHSMLSMMLKGVLVLTPDNLQLMLHLAWRLVNEEDANIATTASVAVIVVALKRPSLVSKLLGDELNNRDVDRRVAAILKFYRLWSNRYQVWQRLEDGASSVLKLPPAAIEFSLPSPRIAMECKPVVDPPYMPVIKSKVDEVAINQEPTIQKTFVAATKTRRKQQIELVTRALQDQADKLREEREMYRFMSVPAILQAAYEPALFHNFSGDNDLDDMEERSTHLVSNNIQVASCFFPSSLTTASLAIMNLLEDNQVANDGNAVHEVAHKVIWNCLTEDATLFLRTLFERLAKDKKMIILQTMRRLVRFMPRLPSQSAYIMYNYLIGFIMHHVRSPCEDSQDIIASVMSLIWLIVPEVNGLFLKDLKQILRKEQCDSAILITANVPAAKKIIVHGPDASSIPSQFPIHEDTQFSQILTDSLDFFGIEEHQHNEYFLVDTKTNQIHNLNAFVRDFYFFKRSQYPQISLVHMNPSDAYAKFQRQAFTLQFTELGKCLMSLALIKTQSLAIQRVLFLHEELMKLPSFPRKALETNLTLYSGPMGKEVLGVDTLHKITWVQLVARMFDVSSGFFNESADLHLFVNVVNGTLLLHCEDASVVRLCMSTYINAAHQFKNIFATNGYLMIVQTMVQIYNNHQTNSLLCRTIEFVFKQFYIIHRKPFVLQMFGAVSPLLDVDGGLAGASTSSTSVQPRAFFQLLQSLGQYTADPLDILELVEAEKPLKPLDFCYQMDSEALSILDAISLCVTVVSYASDSERGHQMLTVLNAVLPLHLRHMQTLTTRKETPGGAKTELQMIHNISVCMKTLIYNCEPLARNFSGPQATTIQVKDSSIKQTASPQFEIDEDSHSKFNIESYYPSQSYARTEMDEAELTRLEFRRPRDLLLKIVAEFLSKSTARLADLSKKISDLHQKGSSYELLDVKCHLRLAEIAHSLLKLAPFDPATMASRGLVRYMNEILPNSEWRQEKMRPALIMVLRRLDKTFTKISKKSDFKRSTDWEAAKLLLKGVYLTFMKHPYIVHLPHLKSLISVCQNIILGDQIYNLNDSSSSSALTSWTVALSQAPPTGFTSVAVRLISLQMIQQGESQTLETLCSGAFASYEKSEIYLMNMIYPLCVRITSGTKDIPKLRQCDINFVLNVILNILKPLNAKASKGSDSSQIGLQMRQFSLQQIGFLGLKILITCFEKQLTTEWYRISKAIRDLADRPQLISITFWNFIDFIVTYRTPLYVLVFSYIKCKFLAKPCDNENELAFRNRIRDKLSGTGTTGMPLNRSRGHLYASLVNEMKALREELIRFKANPPMSMDERSRSIIQEPNSTGTTDRPETSGHRLSFALIAASASKLSNLSSSNSAQLGNSLTPPAMAGAMPAASTAAMSTAEGVTVTTIASANLPQYQFQQQQQHPQPSPTQSARSILLRGFSFRLGTDSRRLATRGLSVKMTSKPVDRKLFARRTSYPDQPEAAELASPGGDLNRAHVQQTQSETKLHRFRNRLLGSSNVTSVSGESLACESGAVASANRTGNDTVEEHPFNLMSLSKEDILPAKHRLQRQKAQNRKSFRLKKSQKSLSGNAVEHEFVKSDTIDLIELKSQPSLKKKGSHESSNSSPGYTTTSQSFGLLSPNEASAADTNRRHATDNCLVALETNLDETIVPDNGGKETNNHCNNNNSASSATASLRSMSLNLTRITTGSIEGLDGETRPQQINNKDEMMSPFEATITSLPFVDED